MHTTNDEQEHKYLSMLVKGSLYFEAVVGIVTLILLRRTLEANQIGNTCQEIKR